MHTQVIFIFALKLLILVLVECGEMYKHLSTQAGGESC